MTITAQHPPVRDRTAVDEQDQADPGYLPPMVEVLGTMRTLTKGAGPGGMPIVMATGGNFIRAV